MRKRTFTVLLGTVLILALGSLGCSVSRFVARGSSPTVTPTRTPRPTWTPRNGLKIATPTLDTTRFPGVTLPTEPVSTAQVLVSGSEGPVFVPVPAEGASGVQTVVVVIVTATPVPPPTETPGPPTFTPGPTDTPGPPTATPTMTATPLPPVMVKVKVNTANVRQGPSNYYPVVAKLNSGTEITVVGRNRDGDWWKVCCVNGADVWIAASAVSSEGPLWAVPEVANIPPAPPTAIPPPTPLPTPTYAWPFRLEGKVVEYPHGQNFFRVDGVLYNGATPLWNYKLRIRKLSTGQEWLSDGSQNTWTWEVLQYPDDGKPVNPNLDCPTPRKGLLCLKSNVKWDSNGIGVPIGDDVWEITVTDGGGTPISLPVRIPTSATNSKWYYVVFTNRP
jgi:hypothetical protein